MHIGKLSQEEARIIVGRFDLADTLGLKAYTDMGEIVKLAKLHHTLSEHACNGELTPGQQTRQARTELRISFLAAELGLTVRFDGDPRGFTVKLFGKPGVHNTWGGAEHGYGVGEK